MSNVLLLFIRINYFSSNILIILIAGCDFNIIVGYFHTAEECDSQYSLDIKEREQLHSTVY